MSEAKPPVDGAEAMASIISPLAGVNPRSLDALMAEDVAKLTDGEFDQIITEQRRLRRVWSENESKKASLAESGEAKPPRTRTPSAKGTVNINLDDLDF